MSDEQKFPACKGMNCGCTDGRSHSLECHAEHAAAIAGGRFVKGTARVEALCRVPEGWRLVPVEPTEEMLAATTTHRPRLTDEPTVWGYRREIWSAMLAAAPPPPGTAPKREALSMQFTFDQARALIDVYNGEPADVTVSTEVPAGRGEHLPEGPGLYAWLTEYPEEGYFFLGSGDQP